MFTKVCMHAHDVHTLFTALIKQQSGVQSARSVVSSGTLQQPPSHGSPSLTWTHDWRCPMTSIQHDAHARRPQRPARHPPPLAAQGEAADSIGHLGGPPTGAHQVGARCVVQCVYVCVCACACVCACVRVCVCVRAQGFLS